MRLRDLGLPCRGAVDESDIAWRLVQAIRSVQPSILLVPHAQERDPEHRKTHSAALEAAWLSASPFRTALGPPTQAIDVILGYEVWTPSVRPALTVDISDQMKTKLDALKCYVSQLAILDLVGAAEGLARYRGALRGACTLAECYTVDRVNEGLLFTDRPNRDDSHVQPGSACWESG